MEEVWIVPKNIRQIGESHGNISIFIEDYAATFISQFAKTADSCMRQGICLGKIYEDTERIHIVIEGIVADSGEIRFEEQLFDDEAKKRMEKEVSDFFDGAQIVGRFVMDSDMKRVSDGSFGHLLGEEGVGHNEKVYFVMSASTELGIGKFYISLHGGMECLNHYYIYYDKNENMQNYLIHWHEKLRDANLEKTSEEQERDKIRRGIEQKAEFGSVPKRERTVSDQEEVYDRTEYLYSRKGRFPFMESAACLIMVCACVTGITSINNYHKMKDFEEVIADVARNFGYTENDQYVSSDSIEYEYSDTMDRDAKEDVKQEGDSAVEVELPLYDPNNVNANDAVTEPYDQQQSETDTDEQDEQDGGQSADEQGEQNSGQSADEQGEQNSGQSADEQGEQNNGQSADEQGEQNSGQSADEQGEQNSGQGADVQDEQGNGQNMDEQGAQTTEDDMMETQTVSYREYIVKQGDTLYGICYSFYQDRSKVSEICRLNGISDPDRLEIGQKILLP